MASNTDVVKKIYYNMSCIAVDKISFDIACRAVCLQ